MSNYIVISGTGRTFITTSPREVAVYLWGKSLTRHVIYKDGASVMGFREHPEIGDLEQYLENYK